jgi:ABC-type multidrug transport system ATPase subunit
MTQITTPGMSMAGHAPAGTVIEASALTMRYDGTITALDQLTVTIKAGVTGLVGANGAGKSTLIKILLGLLEPTSGRALVLGHDCGTYSTGMKQRVKLAQALVGDPRLLLLDEPTNGLDPAGRTQMLELIARIGSEFGISIVVASHLLGEIEQICDHLVAIDAGRLLRADTISSVTQASSVLLVEVDEGVEQLAAELSRRGLAPVAYQRGLLLELAGPEAYDIIRDAVADLGLPLARMEQRRHRIEELFRDDPALAGVTGAASVQ